MRYTLPILTGPALQAQSKPKIGVESVVSISSEPIQRVAEVLQTEKGAVIALTSVALTSGDPTLQHAANTSIAVGDRVVGTGIPDGARVLTVTDSTHFEMTLNASSDVSGGTATLDKLGTAELDLDGAYTAPATGYDMHLVMLTGLQPDAKTVVKLNVVLSDGTAATATGTFAQPLYASQNPDAAQSVAVRLVPSDDTKTIRSITSIASLHGGNVGAKFAVLKLPEESSWVEMEGMMNKNVSIGAPGAVPIADRYNPAKWIKKGRGGLPGVTLSQKYTTMAKGLARYSGQEVSVMIETYDNDTTLAERQVLGSCLFSIDVPRGEANEEVVASASSAFSYLATFN